MVEQVPCQVQDGGGLGSPASRRRDATSSDIQLPHREVPFSSRPPQTESWAEGPGQLTPSMSTWRSASPSLPAPALGSEGSPPPKQIEINPRNPRCILVKSPDGSSDLVWFSYPEDDLPFVAPVAVRPWSRKNMLPVRGYRRDGSGNSLYLQLPDMDALAQTLILAIRLRM